MPSQAAARIRAGGCEAIMCAPHPRERAAWCGRCTDAGGQLYVWTVDEAPKIRALEALGVDGVITNDPRLFDASRRRCRCPSSAAAVWPEPSLISATARSW